jgi:hypothetical protein
MPGGSFSALEPDNVALEAWTEELHGRTQTSKHANPIRIDKNGLVSREVLRIIIIYQLDQLLGIVPLIGAQPSKVAVSW